MLDTADKFTTVLIVVDNAIVIMRTTGPRETAVILFSVILNVTDAIPAVGRCVIDVM